MTTYTAGYNMSGYLPESDPEQFDTFPEAMGFLIDLVDEWVDQHIDAGDEPRAQAYEDLSAHMTYEVMDDEEEFGVVVDRLNLSIWVTKTEEV